MPGLILPNKWTSQPQYPVGIDWSNPLVQALGLTEVWYPRPNLASKTLIRGFSPIVYVPSAVTVGYNINGAGASFLSNTQNNGIAIASSADDIFPDLTQASIFVMRKSADTVLRASTLFGAGVGNEAANNRIILHAPYSDGVTWFEYGSNQTTNKVSIGSTVKTTDTEKFALIAGPSKGREIWKNGVKVIGDTSINAARLSNTDPFRIGSSYDTSSVPSDIETVSLVIIGRKEWPDWAIKALSDNPWQIFKAPARRIWVGASSSDLTVNATLGTADASGFTAVVDRQLTVTAALGTATANGVTASVDRQLSIAATLGTATANGMPANVDRQLTANATLGTAAADGFVADVSLGIGLTVNCSVGAATASGLTATVDRQLTLGCATGTATANGFSATVDRQLAIIATPGQAAAAGYTANIDRKLEVAAATGQAAADGFTATVAFVAAEYGSTFNVTGYFPAGGTVTISLYDPISGAPVSLTSNSCNQIGSTGIYIWGTNKLTTQPSGYQEYPWKLTNGTTTLAGVLIMGEQPQT